MRKNSKDEKTGFEEMKTLSLVDFIELKFPGNILKNAVCFGDCDNDGFSELIVGNSNGELGIFRDDRCIGGCQGLGTIAAVAVGDLLNISRNVLVVVTVEGWCYLFDLQSDGKKKEDSEIPQQFQPHEEDLTIYPFHSQRIPPNSKSLLLFDINEDGLLEMIIGLTDRVLRTYQWRPPRERFDGRDDKDSLDGIDWRGKTNEVYEGALVGMNKWEFGNQIGSVGIHKLPGGSASIIVGQPGGTTQITERPAKPLCDNSLKFPGISTEQSSSFRNQSPSENILIQYNGLEPNSSPRNVTIEVAGNILIGNDNDFYGIGTLDGSIIVAQGSRVELTLQVGSQILSLRELNGNLLACFWNGETYLIQNKKPTRFHFEESVAAFAAGSYASRNDQPSSQLSNKLSLAYVTFNEKIYVYPNSHL